MSLAAELPIFRACPWQHGNQWLCIYITLRKADIAWYCHCHTWSYVFYCFVMFLYRYFCEVKRVWAASLRFNDNCVVVLKSSNCGPRSIPILSQASYDGTVKKCADEDLLPDWASEDSQPRELCFGSVWSTCMVIQAKLAAAWLLLQKRHSTVNEKCLTRSMIMMRFMNARRE